MDPESVDVSAGLGGFLAFFLLAVALYLLMHNMNARMRRMAYREELEAKSREDKTDDDKSDGDNESDPESPDSAGPRGGPDVG